MTNTGTAFRRLHLVALAALLVAAFALRLGVALAFPNVERPDEVFQTLEPAHRLATGWGVTTWEWREGIRSWLFPGFLAIPMRLAMASGLPARAALPVIAALLSAVSLGVVAGAAALGWRHSGWRGALVCGIACAAWPDLVYFAPKTLSEAQGGNLMVIAAILASLRPSRPHTGRWSAAIGLLLGLAFCLRFQFAPAILLVAVWEGRLRLRERWLPLVLGGLVPVAALGVLDFATWGVPFSSVIANFRINLLEGRAATYGTMPAGYYLEQTIALWGAAYVPIGLLFAFGARRCPLLALLAATVVLSHMVIAHKEISFIHPGIVAVILVAGLGAADLVAFVARRIEPAAGTAVGALAAAGWVGLSAATASGNFTLLLNQRAPFLHAAADLRDRPDLGGVGLYGPAFPWFYTGGYTHLDRPVPIYLAGPEALDTIRPAANDLLIETDKVGSVPGYEQRACFDNLCILHRPGSCTPAPDLEINHVLPGRGF